MVLLAAFDRWLSVPAEFTDVITKKYVPGTRLSTT
jgi:hypothetical protein